MRVRRIPGWLAGLIGAAGLLAAWWVFSATVFQPPPGTTFTPVPSPFVVFQTIWSDGLAPYIGVSWDRRLGKTADYVRAAGEDPGAATFVVGLRTWF